MPVSLEVVSETVIETTFKWGFWPIKNEIETGKSVLILEYKENPIASHQVEEWVFDTHDEAVEWYNFIYKVIFLAQTDVQAPVAPAPKSPVKKKASHLSLVKN